MDLKALNDDGALVITSILLAVASTTMAHNYVIIAVFTDNVSNNLIMLSQLHTFSLPCQAELPTIRIPCIAHVINFILGNF
jgi:hypothetical protein